MTTAANPRRNDLVASAGQTVFSYGFEVADQADLVVQQNGTTLTITTHYTVSGVGNENGGSVTLVTPAVLNDAIAIFSDEAIARVADYTTAGDYLAAAVNAEQDKIIRLLGDLRSAVDRTLRLATSDPQDGATFLLPSKASRLGALLRFHETTGIPEAVAPIDLGLTLVSSFMGTLLDDDTAAEARATLGVLNGGILLHKLDGTTAPTVGDDAGDGYSVGSAWFDTTNGRIYECLDASVGAAVWALMTRRHDITVADDLGLLATKDYSVPTWAVEVKGDFSGCVSAGAPQVRVGDATSVKTTGYSSMVDYVSAVLADVQSVGSAFALVDTNNTTAQIYGGSFDIRFIGNIGANYYYRFRSEVRDQIGALCKSSGGITLTGPMTTIRFMSTSGGFSDTFDVPLTLRAY